MNLNILRYSQYDRIKPLYLLKEGDKFSLTAKIDRTEINNGTQVHSFQETKHKENGLYFLRIVMNNNSMWKYTYKGFKKKYTSWIEMDFYMELMNAKGITGVLENKIFYKSMREEQVKNYMVLMYE
jgi:hypothetical protein